MISIRDNIKGGALTETTFLILLALYIPRHGYGIMQFIKDSTGERVALGAGTLYGALNTLLEKGWIVSAEETQNRRKMEYIITAFGKSKVVEEKKRLHEIMELASRITEKG